MEDKQIKTRDRVAKFGEVNTAKKEIYEMLNLVDNETQRFDSRFLEPACGDGNFLITVLKKKLEILSIKFKKNQYEYERNGFVIIGSLYGIDILEDNIKATRKRIYENFFKFYSNLFSKNLNHNFLTSINFVIEKNIIHGDAITLKQANSNDPIVFSEWGLINNKVKRRDFTMNDLLNYEQIKSTPLFSDTGSDVFLPRSQKEYPLIDFDKIKLKNNE